MLLKLVFAACAAVLADCQHLPKLGRLPSISNSLVNLGKMDISFHLNSNGGVKSAQMPRIPDFFSVFPAASSFFGGPSSISSQSSGVCPCMKNAMKDDSRGNPEDFFSRLLSSNKLFTNNKEPISSSICCGGGSMEHVEETVIVDLTKPQAQSFSSIFSPLSQPFVIENLLKAPSLPKMPMQKTKGFEIYLYPNKKDMVKFSPKKHRKSLDTDREGIHPVGDEKALKSELLNIRAFQPIKTSVKKDLNIQEKVMGKIEEEPAKEAKEIDNEVSKGAGPGKLMSNPPTPVAAETKT